jgi:hypothetical protein
LSGTTLSRLAVKAAIAGMFLTGIGVAFLEGYEGYTRVHADPASAGAPVIAAQAQRALSSARLLDGSDAYNPSAVSETYQSPKAQHAVVRTATPTLFSAPTRRTWAPHPSQALGLPQYPAVRTPVPAVQRSMSVPASYTPPLWRGPSPAAPYGYAPGGFSPAPSALPPRRLRNRVRGCGFG